MVNKILEERGERYGSFIEHARITQDIKETLKTGESWDICTDTQKQSLELFADKMARIVNGDPDYDDSWVDIIGYAQLIVNELHDNEDEPKDEPEDIPNGYEELLDEFEDKTIITSENVQLIEINGIKVFITDDELIKLEALNESEFIQENPSTNEDEDHENQTYIDFENATKALAEDFINTLFKQ